MVPAAASYARARGLALRLGAAGTMALLTVLAVVSSVVCTLAILMLFDAPQPLYRPALLVSLAVPVLIAPPLAWLMTHLVFEAEAARQLAERLAVTDELTGLANRRQFMTVAQSALARARRAGQTLSVLALDIDHFKDINDAHGHATGDSVLQVVAAACRADLRDYDTLSRQGGEEFAALLPDTEAEMALTIGERVRTAVAALALTAPDGTAMRLTVSVGAATLRADAETDSIEQLLDRADRAMYEAKQAGRNRVRASP